jgi:hypothetical protein
MNGVKHTPQTVQPGGARVPVCIARASGSKFTFFKQLNGKQK